MAAPHRNPFDLRVSPDYDSMSRVAADVILAELDETPDLLLAAATGSSPTRTYQYLAAEAQVNADRFGRLRLLKVDEWGGLPMTDPATCEAQLRRQLVEPLKITPDRFASFRSDTPDPTLECERIRAWLDINSPIDLCVLGLGANGHLAFNEPGDSLQFGPHVAALSAESMRHPMIKDSRVRPEYGLTIGMGDILRARRVLLLVTGSLKAAQLRRLLACGITTRFPASLLSLHPQATILCDAPAAAGLGPVAG